MGMWGRTLSLVVSLFAVSVVRSEAATYYVATNGDDANLCTLSAPCRTINHGASLLTPGDTLYVRTGTYDEELYDRIPSGTSWSSPVTVAAYPGERVVMRPTVSDPACWNDGAQHPPCRVITFERADSSYIIIDGLILDGANVTYDTVKMDGWPGDVPHHIRIQNSELMNGGQGLLGCGDYTEVLNNRIHDNGRNDFDHGIYCAAVGVLIEGNDIYRNAGWGIHIYNNAPTARDNIIRNNRVHDNARVGPRGSGMIVGAGSGHLVYNNLIWANANGLDIMYGGASDIKAFNNTIYRNRGAGIAVYNAPNVSIQNNIIAENGGKAIDDIEGNTGLLISHNLTDADPRFVNPSASDFRLQSTSPAIDAGLSLSEVPADIEGTPRPQGTGFDLGAYEYRATALLPGDLNKDGQRDLADVRLLIYMLLGQQAKTPEADLTGDGAVTLADVQALIRLLVGLP